MKLVDYELAKKLKEKGFRKDCIAKVNFDNTITFNHVFNDNIRTVLKCHNKLNSYIDAPTISQVLKWLRKEKKIYVSILPLATHSTINKVAFYYLIEYNSTGETMEGIEQNTYCAEWKDAALAGIEYVLDNLI